MSIYILISIYYDWPSEITLGSPYYIIFHWLRRPSRQRQKTIYVLYNFYFILFHWGFHLCNSSISFTSITVWWNYDTGKYNDKSKQIVLSNAETVHYVIVNKYCESFGWVITGVRLIMLLETCAAALEKPGFTSARLGCHWGN